MTASIVKSENSPTATDSNIRLKDILKTLPRECFQRNQQKAWSLTLINVLMVALGYWSITLAPWFLLPFCWFFTGTALTGFFVIAHDCGHRSFAKRRWVNDLVGHVFMMPLIYPFHSWRILHNYHHVHTNELDVDNAWQPYKPEFFESTNLAVQVVYEALRKKLWWVASLIHWGGLHFNLAEFSPKDHQKVKLSIAVVVGFAAIAFPTLIATTGIWGFVKFWLMPWLCYHFWMSTFTLVHHTAPNIQFHPTEQWNAAQAQLSGTVHCGYPRWIEFLCHDINVHIPHHISTAIPSYNLRLAHQSLKQHWGEHLQERQFSWALIREITEQCHLYNAETCYQSFKDYRANS